MSWAVSDKMGQDPVRDLDTVAVDMTYCYILCMPFILNRTLSMADLNLLPSSRLFYDDRLCSPESGLTMDGYFYGDLSSESLSKG